MRYLIAKQEALKEINYDVRIYILNHNYYQYTSKYHLSATQWLTRKIIFNCLGILICLIGCVLLAVAIALSCLMVNNFNYFGGSIACYIIGILLIGASWLTLAFKPLMDAQKVVTTFKNLLVIKAISPDLNTYPLLMQKFLATYGKLNINNQAWYYVPISLTWELYLMIDFYHQLNTNYLNSSSQPLIGKK